MAGEGGEGGVLMSQFSVEVAADRLRYERIYMLYIHIHLYTYICHMVYTYLMCILIYIVWCLFSEMMYVCISMHTSIFIFSSQQ